VKTLKISIVPTTLLAKINSFLGMSFYRIFIFGKIGLFQWPQKKRAFFSRSSANDMKKAPLLLRPTYPWVDGTNYLPDN